MEVTAMEPFSLNCVALQEYQPNRYPFLMIDHVDAVLPGKFARGYKHLTLNEWYFPVHFPGGPNMPGALQLEALAQMLTVAITTLPGLKGLEPRGALWVKINIDGVDLNVLTTHLGLVPREQRLQAAALVGKEWLGHPDCTGPTLLAGDFNATGDHAPFRRLLRGGLRDAFDAVGRGSGATWPSGHRFLPALLRLDHVVTGDGIGVGSLRAVPSVGSDHARLVAELGIPDPLHSDGQASGSFSPV
jgi:endonuclease/exonuclease/phosphatase family metal-dependent hydrolase